MMLMIKNQQSPLLFFTTYCYYLILVFIITVCSSSSVFATVTTCYSCTSDVGNGRTCENPYHFDIVTCQGDANDACITVYNEDGGIWRGCSVKQRCAMFPLFETGECCYTDFCNLYYTSTSKRNFALVAFVQFGLPALNILLITVMIAVTILLFKKRLDQNKAPMPIISEKLKAVVIPKASASMRASIDVRENVIYVRPQTPVHRPIKQKSNVVVVTLAKDGSCNNSLVNLQEPSPPLRFQIQPASSSAPLPPLLMRPPSYYRNIGSSGSCSTLSSMSLSSVQLPPCYENGGLRPIQETTTATPTDDHVQTRPRRSYGYQSRRESLNNDTLRRESLV